MTAIYESISKQMISTTAVPSSPDWAFYPMYNESQLGQTRVWQVGFREDTLITRHGVVGGKIQEDRVKVEVNKSGRSLQDQALLEARKKYTDKYRDGYRPSSDISIGNTYTVQLANKYVHPSQGKTNIHKFPVSIQAKIDGIRGMSRLVDGKVVIASRKGLLFPWLDHIKEDLFMFFSYLPEGVVIDGEIYSPDMTFETLTSAVKTTKTKSYLNEKVYYYIFDIIIPGMYLEDRIKVLNDGFEQFIADGNSGASFNVLEFMTADSHDQLLQYHVACVEAGYEGIMIRQFAYVNPGKPDISLYKGKRNNNLMKYKTFIDEEGTVVDVVDGDGREKGLALLVIRDDDGRQFTVRPRSSFETRKDWFRHREKLIGKRYTYRFFERTEKGIPRFPVGVAFRDYE